MQITEIIVSAGRTFNHPFESYSNLRPSVSLKAALAPGDDPDQAIKDLQAKAESLIEDHKEHILKSIDELHELALREREMVKLQDLIRISQQRLEDLRQGQQALAE